MDCGLCGQPIAAEPEALMPRHDLSLLERQIARLTTVREEIERNVLRADEVGRVCRDCLHFMGPYGRGNLTDVVNARLDQVKRWWAEEQSG
jgi:hypothetical protein